MANIKTLSISIKADVSDFTKGLEKSRRDLNKWAKDIPGATMNVSTAFAAAGAAAGAGLAYLTQQAFKSIDETAKLSDRLGIATEMLTGLQHAADLAGVTSEALAGGLEKLMKNLQPGDDPSVEIMRIADTIQSMKDPVERAQFAMEKFGKSGQQLIPMLSGGAAGLREMAAENEKFALSFSRMDAAKVEAANDALTNVWNVLKGVGNTLAIQVAPFIEAAAKAFTNWATAGGGLKQNVAGTFEMIIQYAAKAADAISGLEATWHSVKAAVAGFTMLAAQALKLQIDFYNLPGKLATGKEIIPTESLQNFIEISRTDAQQALKDMDRAAGDFANGTWSQKAIQGIRGIQIESEKAAKSIAAMQTAGSNLRAEMENKFTGDPNQRPEGALEAFQDFAGEEHLKKVQEFADQMAEALKTPWEVFEEKAKMAQEAYAQQPELLAKALDRLADERDRALGPLAKGKQSEIAAGEFQQFDLSRVNVSALARGSKKQEVKAPELEAVLNKSLETQRATDQKLDKLSLGFA